MSAGDNFVGDIFMLVEDDIMLKFTRAQGVVHNFLGELFEISIGRCKKSY